MTATSTTPFDQQYEAALRLHLSGSARNRSSSRAARSLGRVAFDADLNTLDVVRIHDLAMSTIAEVIPADSANHPPRISPGAVFLLESLTALKKLVMLAQQTAEKAQQNDAQALARNSLCYKELLDESQRLQKQSQRLAHQILIAQEEERREIRFTATKKVESMDNLRCTVFYRVTQEALLNVIRHAAAQLVIVQLKVIRNGIRLEVRDDGKGFQVQKILDSDQYERLGLLGMKERVEMVDGKFLIESTAGKGTTIRVDIPFAKTSDEGLN